MGSLAFRQNYASIIPGRHKLSRAISHKLAARIRQEILRRKKAVFRRNTLCISRAIPYKSARESGERFFVRKRWKTAGILCVFQGFTNEFLAEKIRQNPQTHLCGVAQEKITNFRRKRSAEARRHIYAVLPPKKLQNNSDFSHQIHRNSTKALRNTAYKNPRPPQEDGDFKKLSR